MRSCQEWMWKVESVNVESLGREEGNAGPGVLQCGKIRGEIRQQRLRRSGQPGSWRTKWDCILEIKWRQCFKDDSSDLCQMLLVGQVKLRLRINLRLGKVEFCLPWQGQFRCLQLLGGFWSQAYAALTTVPLVPHLCTHVPELPP